MKDTPRMKTFELYDAVSARAEKLELGKVSFPGDTICLGEAAGAAMREALIRGKPKHSVVTSPLLEIGHFLVHKAHVGKGDFLASDPKVVEESLRKGRKRKIESLRALADSKLQ